jgi:DNA helicase HerA-like ATPase
MNDMSAAHDNVRANGAHEPEATLSPVQQTPADVFANLEEDITAAGGEWTDDAAFAGAVGRTMFDTPTSKDNTLTVLLPADQLVHVPAQSLVRIKSRPLDQGGDGRQYLGAVVEGPFAEPDGLRADAPIVVTTTVRGSMFMPRHHGRVQVAILGEEVDDTMVPPRFRPLPNSPVFVLDDEETAEKLNLLGDITLGLAVGYEEMPVRVSSLTKTVFPRHTGILGTTGGGKSTTVSGLVNQLQHAGTAVVLFDTEGEYTQINEPTDDRHMIQALQRRGLAPNGVEGTQILHLIGRETTNPSHPRQAEFSLNFADLSPYAVISILELTDAQEERYLKAYDLARDVLRQLGIYPATEEEKAALLELDEMERGYPKLTLQHMYDIVHLCADQVAKESNPTYLKTPLFHERREQIIALTKQGQLPQHTASWRALQGALSRLLRLGIFDNPKAAAPNYASMIQPGRVTIIDLGDTGSPQVNNLVISQILRGLHLQQDANYQRSEHDAGEPMTRLVIIIEEAHEFLSATRRQQMPILFEQVARIARRGRKRWIGLIFVTQLPQHLPDEVLGLINNYILHKIGDNNVISRLKRSIGGIDESLWDRLPNLAPGQAIISTAGMTRPLLVAIDPTPCKLRMVE